MRPYLLIAATLIAVVCIYAGVQRRNEQPVNAVPPSRGGHDLIGKPISELTFDRWLNTKDNQPIETNGHVTLYRWWTDTCPFCAASLPAIEQLRRKYDDQGFRTICVYHPKPPRSVDDETIAEVAGDFGYAGPIAVDEDWSQLIHAYLADGRRQATSVSILVDTTGIIRYIHPGPVFFGSDDPEHKQENEDYLALDTAISVLLQEEAETRNKQADSGDPQ
ncbi:MAG: TlpA disulfide reductase family protein [Phycisphaeraceae bacterium]